MKSEHYKDLAITILAAGQGKRMKNPDTSKVMAELAGKPLIAHVIEQAEKLRPSKIVVIVGHKKEMLIEFINSKFKNIEFAEQNEQLGTGHAVAQTEINFEDFTGDILILSGDVPLLQAETLQKFINKHMLGNYDISVLSTKTEEPFGYGRIVRDNNDTFLRIVEEKDADEQEKEITEINSGIYLVNAHLLFDSLRHISNNNSQGEYYLTDIVEILYNKDYKVGCYPGADMNELQGINSPEDLVKAEKYYAETCHQ